MIFILVILCLFLVAIASYFAVIAKKNKGDEAELANWKTMHVVKTSNNEVKMWLSSINHEGFNKYFDVFTQNGFVSLDLIKEIDEISHLELLGISNKAHQIILMKKVRKLNGIDNEEGICTA